MLPACDGRIDAEHAAPWLPAGTNASEQAPNRTNAKHRGAANGLEERVYTAQGCCPTTTSTI